MAIQVIYLDESDDLSSIRDHLSWVQENQAVLVLPPKGDLLIDYLELALLQRQAVDLRIELGLITTDSRVKSQAKALGIPTFPSVRSAEKGRRRWWRGRRRSEWLGQPTRLDDEDLIELNRRKKPEPSWRRWLLRYLAIIIYFFTLAIIFVAVAYAVPAATITLEPEIQPIAVKRQIVADPVLEKVSQSGVSVPGRVLKSIQVWQSDVEVTGLLEVADSNSQGRVILVNQLSEPVSVPAGTRVSTSGGSRKVFQITESIDLPGVAGATVEAPIMAIEPGHDSNVESGLINRIQGPLAAQLDVRNLEPTEGGGTRSEPTVTAADQERLRSQVMQQIQVRALADMERMLTDSEFLARDSLRVRDILDETYSHFPGEQTDRLTLEIRAELLATAVDETQATGLIYEELTGAVEPGFELVPSSLVFRSGDVLGVDGEGRVTFEMEGSGTIAAQVDIEKAVQVVAGQRTGEATAYLFEHLPLRDYPRVTVWPNWFGRLPYLPVRIQALVDTTG